MQILIAGSASEDRANILEALAKIKPGFSVIFIDRETSTETIQAASKAFKLHAHEPIEYIPPPKPKYTCKGNLKRR